jgi:molybdate transport system substrate-binding protein
MFPRVVVASIRPSLVAIISHALVAIISPSLVAIVTLSLAAETAAAAKPEPRELVVFEAAPLKDVLARLAKRFEARHAGVKVVASAAGSRELRAQIEHGGAADVFATVDHKDMDALAKPGLVVGPAIFACNQPVVVVRKALAASIKTFADLPRAERIVVGVPDAPIGADTLEILKKAAASKLGADFGKRVEAHIASRELDVRQILAKVVLGEADAGVVYRSDLPTAKGKVAVVPIPPELNVTAEYPIAPITNAAHPELARAFIELVQSPAGTAALKAAGFSSCPAR